MQFIALLIAFLLCLNACGESIEEPTNDSTRPIIGAMPTFKLPFQTNESWVLTRAYNTDTHRDYGSLWIDDRYALDFVETGCTSWRKPILAAASGTVELWHNQVGGYGHNILIDHGGGWKTRYAHMDELTVIDGQQVVQGQEVGKAGNSGNVSGSACPSHPGLHLHFVLYKDGKGVPPEPISSFSGLKAGLSYKSNNTLVPAPYVFKKGPANPQLCANEPTGSLATNWVYTCTPKTGTIKVKEPVWGLIGIEKIAHDFGWKAEVRHTDELTKVQRLVTTYQWNSSGVDPWGWDRSYYWPWVFPDKPGAWEIWYYVRIIDQQPTIPIAKLPFTVADTPPYTYNGNGTTCARAPSGSAATNWVYSCDLVSTFTFSQNPTVYGMLYVENIFKNYKFVTKFYKDGLLIWTDDPVNYTVVEPWVWRYGYAFPQIQRPQPGNWRIEVNLLFADGTPSVKLRDIAFTVRP